MTDLLFAALALMFVIEGMLPFIAPRVWREMFAKLTQMNDGQIRFAGLASMVAGLVLLYIAT